MNIAQFNIAKIRYPLDDPRMAEFMKSIDFVNSLTDNIDGFIHRVKDESGYALNIKLYEDKDIVPNLTVWKNIESLKLFVFKTLHGRFMKRREEWFIPIEGPLNVLWYVEENYIPSMQEGVDRLNYFKYNGNSNYAFDWEYVK